MEDFFAGLAQHWPPGREDYCWQVLPSPQPARERLADSYRELADWPGLAAVQAEWMHIPLHHLAPAAQITGSELATITRMVRGRCAGIAPFTVTAGRAEAWETSVVCPVRPGYLLRFLHQVITDVSREVTAGRAGGEPPAYCPHLPLAYAVAHVDHGPVRAWISDCEAGEVRLPVTGLVLAAQQHDRRQISWRIIDEVALTGGPPSAA